MNFLKKIKGFFSPEKNKYFFEDDSFFKVFGKNKISVDNLLSDGKFVQMVHFVNAFENPIMYIADKFKNGIIYAEDDKGNFIEDDELVFKLNNPNLFQKKEEFLFEYFYFLTSAGWNYVYPRSESYGFNRISEMNFFNLNPDLIKFPEIKETEFSLKDIDFIYKSNDTKTKISTSEIVRYYDISKHPNNPYKGLSRLENLLDEARITLLGNKAKENQITRSGATLITRKNEDRSDLTMEMPKEIHISRGKATTEKDRVEYELNKNLGLAANSSIVISNVPYDVIPLSKGIDNLDFDKITMSEMRKISQKIGVPYDLQVNDGQNSKYDNRAQAELSLIQDRIEPVANSFIKGIQNFFKDKYKYNLKIDYTHLPAYQESENLKEKNKDLITNRVISMLDSNLITHEQSIQMLKNYDIL